MRYGLSEDADIRAEQIQSQGLRGVEFDLLHAGDRRPVHLPLLGAHSVHAALAAAAVGIEERLSLNDIAEALQQLSPAQRDLFVRYHLRNQDIRDLAARTGRTPHAIEESLSNIRRRLAALLTSRGWTDTDAQSLFHAPQIKPAGGLTGL